MKNMKKLVALLLATMMILSLSVSAFAVAVDTDASKYDEADDTVFNLVFTTPDGSEAAQLTMIAYLVPADTDPANIPAYTGADDQEVVAIDQVGGNEGFGEVPVDVAKLEDGYAIAVAIGGTGISTAAKYLVTYNEESGTLYVYGDLNDDGSIDTIDAGIVLSKFVNSQYQMVVPDDYADVNDDGAIDTVDAGLILSRFVNSETIFPAEQ